MTPDDGYKAHVGTRLTVSLRAVLFVVFICACISRWIAHYGGGVGLILAWAFALGGVVGILIGCVALTVRVLNHRQAHAGAGNRLARQLAASAVAGASAGALSGALGFAAATVAAIEHLLIRGFWIDAQLGRGPSASDASQEIALFVLIPAFVGSVATSIAGTIAKLQDRPLLYALYTASATGAVAVLFPSACLAAWTAMTPYDNRPNILALIVAVVWFVMLGAAAFVGGALVSVMKLWMRWSAHEPLSRVALWIVVIVLVIIITEAALRGWVRTTFAPPARIGQDHIP